VNDRLVSARLGRQGRVRAAMAVAGLEALVLSLGADLPWLSGYEAMPLERPTVLVLPVDDPPTLVVPRLEAPRVDDDPRLFRLQPWGESEDPLAMVADALGRRRRLAISDRCWASLLLGLQVAVPQASWRRASAVTGPLRSVKDPEEVATLAAAGAAADAVSAALLAGEIALVGRTEAAVSEEIGARLRAGGHARVNFAIVASGPNAASPHHEPGERRIGPGETVVCDFGGTFRLGDDVGYCSDTTRTVVTGEPGAELVELYAVLAEAQEAAVAAVRPGVPCEEIDAVGRRRITAAGQGERFVHRIGHGIGIEEHEDPYLVEGNATPLVEGHVFSVEPGIYLPGRMGARIEDIVVATAGGPRRLNRADRSLRVVDA
jgi:Xaa-Pro aminopeptidase